MIKSVYIHIPFCDNICSYCDFCKMYYNEKLVDKYLDALEYEIKKRYKKDKIKTIYIGGGTPSSLNIRQLKKLFKIIDILNKEKLEEYTFEANFSSIDDTKLKILKDNGINRLSFGLETLDKEKLKQLVLSVVDN